MYYLKKTFLLIIFLLILSCGTLPGINEKPKKKISSEIDQLNVQIIDLNEASEDQINYYNLKDNLIESNKVKKFKEIYNYKYKYILDAGDKISIDLTDSDDIDNTYEIEPDGSIDVPFIGKIKIAKLSELEAQNLLISVLEKYYKNPELQMKIEEFNSSWIYVIGAVTTPQTIALNQKAISLLDAAMQANFSPTGEDKLYGTKGFLRRNDVVYKIDINNVLKGKDSKENFYLKNKDVIFFDRNSDSIHVFGELNTTGAYFPNLDYSLTELLSISGVNQLTANAKNVYVIREDLNKFLHIDVFKLNIQNPVNLIKGGKFLLKAKDILFIPPAEIVKWNRAISLLLPQTDLFNSYNPIIQSGVKSGSNINLTEK